MRATSSGARHGARPWTPPALALGALLAALVAEQAVAVPFWGDRQSLPPETDPATLSRGRRCW